MADTQDAQSPTMDQIITLRVSHDLYEKAENASRITGLKKADVIRLSIDRGVDILIAQLGSPAVPATTMTEVES